MSRALIAFCALFAAASAADWAHLLRPENDAEMNAVIRTVVEECAEGTALTYDSIVGDLKKYSIEAMPHPVACAVECFLENGPGVVDKVTKKLYVSDDFPAEVRYSMRACADNIEAQNVADSCVKALTFRQTCMPIFYVWSAQQRQ